MCYDMDNSLQIVNTNREMQEWSNKIQACRSSSLSVRAWCRENNVPLSSFYYWQKKIFNRVSGRESSFVEIPVSAKSNYEAIAKLTVNGIAVELLSGISAKEIAEIIAGLGLKQC